MRYILTISLLLLAGLSWAGSAALGGAPRTALEGAPKAGGALKTVQFYVASELPHTADWRERICRDLASQANSLGLRKTGGGGLRFASRCFEKTSAEILLLQRTRVIDPGIAATFLLVEDYVGDLRLTYIKTATLPEVNFPSVEWKIKMARAPKGREALRRLIQNALAFQESEVEMTKFFVRSGARFSSQIAVKPGTDEFVDKKTGRSLTWKEALQRFLAEDQKQANYLRASLELAAALGGGVRWYYSNHALNAPDQQYSTKDLPRRFTSFDVVRYDDNSPGVNKKHVYEVGTGYYLIGRSNGLSGPEALLASFASSTLWEYLVEYQEVVSINDQILTPYGGFVIGEVLYQIGRAFRASQNSFSRNVLGKLFDPMSTLNHWLDGELPGRSRRHENSMDASAFRSLKFYFGEGSTNSSDAHGKASIKEYGLDMNVIEIPDMDKPGRTKFLQLPGGFNELLVRSTKSETAADEFRIFAKTSLFVAFHKKNLQYDEGGELRGYSVAWGPISTMTLNSETRPNGTSRDMEATVGLLGNAISLSGYFKGYRINLQLDVIGDFAMIQSYAIEGYKETHDISGAPSQLRSQGYSYGFGTTTRTKISLSYGGLEAGAAYAQTQIDATNLRSRYYESVTQPLAVSELQSASEVFGAVTFREQWRLHCGLQLIRRSGIVENYAPAARVDHRKQCTLSVDFK